jgi:hypothetical protein
VRLGKSIDRDDALCLWNYKYDFERHAFFFKTWYLNEISGFKLTLLHTEVCVHHLPLLHVPPNTEEKEEEEKEEEELLY